MRRTLGTPEKLNSSLNPRTLASKRQRHLTRYIQALLQKLSLETVLDKCAKKLERSHKMKEKEKNIAKSMCFGSSVASCVTFSLNPSGWPLHGCTRLRCTAARETAEIVGRHEQASVRMAVITAGHHSYRKAAWIEIGVQAGTLFVSQF